MPLPLSEHVANTHRAYNTLVEHLVPTSAELNDWLPTLRNVAPARLEELRELGPRANWSGEYGWPFRHFVTERRRVFIEEYMAEHLSAADFAEWVGAFSSEMLHSMTRKT